MSAIKNENLEFYSVFDARTDSYDIYATVEGKIVWESTLYLEDGFAYNRKEFVRFLRTSIREAKHFNSPDKEGYTDILSIIDENAYKEKFSDALEKAIEKFPNYDNMTDGGDDDYSDDYIACRKTRICQHRIFNINIYSYIEFSIDWNGEISATIELEYDENRFLGECVNLSTSFDGRWWQEFELSSY